MSRAATLRKRLDGPEIIVMPGAYDVLTAVLVERAGFDTVFTTGFGASASMLGVPDIGLLTMPEAVDLARRVTNAVNIPLVADMDTGYGNPLNVIRTVEQCMAADVGGIILEDQEWPKKCGHFEGKRVIPLEDHVQKIRAAVDARSGHDLVLIARTDARAPLGMEEAVRRGRAYRDAGADVVFIEAPRSMVDLETIVRAFPDAPLFANMIEGGVTPFLSYQELQEIGFKMVVYPLSSLFTTANAVARMLGVLRETGTTAGFDHKVSFEEFEAIVDTPKYRAMESEYSVR